MNSRASFYYDLLERSLWTFIQAFAGIVVVSDADMWSADAVKAAALAGGIAVIKGLVVSRLPWTADDSASTLPASVDPPQEAGQSSLTIVLVVLLIVVIVLLLAGPITLDAG